MTDTTPRWRPPEERRSRRTEGAEAGYAHLPRPPAELVSREAKVLLSVAEADDLETWARQRWAAAQTAALRDGRVAEAAG